MRHPIRLPYGSSLIRVALLAGYLVGLLCGVTSCATFVRSPAEQPGGAAIATPSLATQCEPNFQEAPGWHGGDAAYSVRLPGDGAPRTLWLFGDSFVDRPRKPGQRSFPFIHNSVGISRCEDGGLWSFEPYWQAAGTPSPSAFFRPSPNAEWVKKASRHTDESPYYWLFSGFVIDDALYVGLLRVVSAPPRGPLRLPFRLAGMDLAQIANPTAPPSEWEIEILRLSDDETLLPGAAFVVNDDYVYAFSFFDRDDGHAPRGLTRFSAKALREDPTSVANTFETLDRDGNWAGGILPERAKILFPGDATEMSVHHDSHQGRWLAVDASPLPANGPKGLGNSIRLRHAKHLTGPWSDPIPIYTIPETIPNSKGEVDPNLACYAAKAHPHLSNPGELVVTYVCNLFARKEGEEWQTLRRLAASPALYQPKAVHIVIPPLDDPAP